MNFRIGQEVVCICDPGEWHHERGATTNILPQKREVYLIVGFAPPFSDGSQALQLSEFPGFSFASTAFRPVTNISVFTEILERETIPSTEKEKV